MKLKRSDFIAAFFAATSCGLITPLSLWIMKLIIEVYYSPAYYHFHEDSIFIIYSLFFVLILSLFSLFSVITIAREEVKE